MLGLREAVQGPVTPLWLGVHGSRAAPPQWAPLEKMRAWVTGMIGQERNADDSIFTDEVFPAQGEMRSPDTPEEKQATRVCPEAPGRWGRGKGMSRQGVFSFF